MSYNSKYGRWTSQLVDSFSSGHLHKDLNSTSHSFNKYSQSAVSQSSYKEMPNTYKRYADSLESKKKKYLNTGATFDYLSSMPFVDYRHHQQNYYGGKHDTLKKKGRRCTCKCREQQPDQTMVIKEIHHVYHQNQPTIVREVPQPYTVVRPISVPSPTTIVRSPVTQTRPVSIIQRTPIQSISRSRSNSRSASNGKVTFSYISPPKTNTVQSFLYNPLVQKANSPYKLLASSRKSQYIPEITISPPLLKNQISSYSFGQKDSDLRKQGNRIADRVEPKTAHFLELRGPSNTTSMSSSFKIHQLDDEISERTMTYHKFRADPIRQ